jgi:spore coat protein U-like protein
LKPIVSKGVFILCSVLGANAVEAQTCSASASNLDFGDISPVSGIAVSSSATITITCSGFGSALPVRACIGIGSGSGGNGLTPRTAEFKQAKLQYNLYNEASATRIWGTRLDPALAPIAIDIPLAQNGPLAGGQQSVTIHGRLPGGQSALPAGTYLTSFSGAAQTQVAYRQYAQTPPSCEMLTDTVSPLSFSVVARVIDDCTVSAAPLDFGTVGLLDTPLTASAALTLACTRQSAYSVALSAGGVDGANSSDRRMKLLGGNSTTRYQLYQDAGYRTVWGDGSDGSAVVSGIGTGKAQNQTVYARVLPQITPAAGRYTDTIIVTVSY